MLCLVIDDSIFNRISVYDVVFLFFIQLGSYFFYHSILNKLKSQDIVCSTISHIIVLRNNNWRSDKQTWKEMEFVNKKKGISLGN